MKDKIINGFKWTTISTLFSNIIGIAIPFYLALYIEPSDFGKLAIITILYGFLNMLFRPAFGEARIQKDDIYDSQEIDDVIFTINLIKMIVITFILYQMIPFLNSYYKDSFNLYIYILIIVNIISAFRSPRIYLLAKRLDFRKANLLEIISSTFGSIFSLSLAVYTKEISSILYGMLVSALIRTFLSQYFVLYKYKVSFSFYKITEIFSFGIWVMVERVLSNIGQNIDRILLSIFLDLHWLGIYQMAKSIGSRLFYIITQIVNRVLFPIFSNMKNKNILTKKKIYKFMYMFMFLSVFISICTYFFLPFLINLLGNKWQESLNIGRYMILSGLFMFLSSVILMVILKSLGDAKITALAQLYKVIILIVLTLILGYYFHLYGIVSAVIISEFIILVFVLIKMKKGLRRLS